ncbi:hypothetical protein STEG23_002505 [Scotinomys teguina]
MRQGEMDACPLEQLSAVERDVKRDGRTRIAERSMTESELEPLQGVGWASSPKEVKRAQSPPARLGSGWSLNPKERPLSGDSALPCCSDPPWSFPYGPLVPVPSSDMEEFLQRAKSKLVPANAFAFTYNLRTLAHELVLASFTDRSKRLEKVHAVIGSKSCDLDSLISAFTYAYFLDKVSPPGVLCLPVLNIPRTEFNYFTETRFILEELNISESFHIFRDEINLHELNDEGKLSITLVGSHVLGSEDRTLEAVVVRVINPGSILFKWMTMDPELPEKQEDILSILEEQFPNLPPRDDIISVLQETQLSAQGLSLEQTMLKDLKELSDGEIKVAVSTVNMTLESGYLPIFDWSHGVQKCVEIKFAR